MKKAILGLLLGLAAMTSLPSHADDWGNWGATKKGRVESAVRMVISSKFVIVFMLQNINRVSVSPLVSR
ncbi:hypothetical protein [Photobacterium piscicola]|uniref:hypothetical protein n=1 Tax=Photobacterium piscicola TaxID=1378299 RepID=UPI0037366275